MISNGVREEQISINSLKTNYKIAGSGPAILILNGWGSKAERWVKVGEMLVENGYKIVIPDLPGFGGTDVPPKPWGLNEYCGFIADFTKTLNLEKFYLLGHSFGGALAVKYTLRFPEKIEKLFLMASACIRKKTIKKWVLVRISKFFKIFSFLPFYALARKVFYKFIVSGSDYQYTKGVMKESFLKVVNEDLSKVLSLINVPTVIIWGAKDDTTLVEDAYFIEREINNSKLIIIPEGDHDLEQKMPETLTEKIIKNLTN